MSRREAARKRRALLVTLGCAKNLVDSEHMVALLEAAGFEVRAAGGGPDEPLAGLAEDGDGAGDRIEAPGPAGGEVDVEAEVAVVNTCGFVADARAESYAVIGALARLREEGRLGRLVVAGCLAQRGADELLRRFPQVDAVVGTGEFPRIAEVVGEALAGGRVRAVGEPAYRYDDGLPRARLTPPFTAYVKIAEGCDHTCAFCAIPALRGRFRSRPLQAVVAEVEKLAAQGVREVNLVAQDSAAYGRDLAGRPLLPELLRRLDAVPGLRWIRVLYNHPTTFTPGIAAAMAELEKVCPYVDVPLQHGSDRVLAAMGRGWGRDALLRRLGQVRAALPDAVLRSSFIVGFPGETEEDFRALLAFLREAELDYAGFFAYSREEGTPAAALPRQVPERVKERRLARALDVQARVSLRRNQARVGRVLEVLVEGPELGQPGFFRGRWRGQAPEVDGVVIFSAPGAAAAGGRGGPPAGRVPEARAAGIGPSPGDLVAVRITWADEFDLHGEAVPLPAAPRPAPVGG